MKKYYAVLLCGAVLSVVSCKKESGNTNNPPVADQIAPDGFNFSTSRQISINVRLLTNDNKPLPGVLVNVYATPKAGEDKSLLSVMSGADGSIKASITIPAYLDTLYIDPAYVGLMRNAKAVINANTINGVIGGADGLGGDIVANEAPGQETGSGTIGGTLVTGRGTSTFKYNFISPYDSYGRPTKLVSPSDVISSSLLSYINTSLPEGKAVPSHHPEFLKSSAVTAINVVKASDVWVTFVSDGADYYNTLGYYTYPTGKPPVTQTDVDSIHLIFPNTSLSGSGGAMHSGDKIYLGRFDAGTSVGYVLLQNAWVANYKGVYTGGNKFFTDDALNTSETNTALRRHAVLLYDNADKLFLTGFEDETRSEDGSDNDFNDLIFYTTASPSEGISTTGVTPIDSPTDTDGDGVTDVNDKFPTDATRAYIQYYPAETTWGTLTFEDLWPYTGDYDLNDNVIGYRYKYIKNAQNSTVEMYGDYYIRAIGATFINGFGVQLPVAYSKVSTVTGQKLIAGYIKTNANGTEAGQTNAVIIPFDDTRSLYPSGGFTNTLVGATYLVGDSSHVYIKFTSPIAATELSADVYNPFLISNQRRGYEIHLAGSKPTDKADKTIFGTYQDNSNIATNRYYLSAKNWPWAISFVEDFDYPSEKNNVAIAYLNFLTWAQSGGTQYTDWYKNLSGYRNTAFIYHR